MKAQVILKKLGYPPKGHIIMTKVRNELMTLFQSPYNKQKLHEFFNIKLEEDVEDHFK